MSNEYDTHTGDAIGDRIIPISVLENEFINSRPFIRTKIAMSGGRPKCDRCGHLFPAKLPMFIKINDADEELLCYPCDYKRNGIDVAKMYRDKRPEGERIKDMKEQKMEQSKAYQIANRLIETLSPFCQEGFCNIAGSLRRKKPDPKDIEIVCLPLTIEEQDGFFDTKKVRNPEFISKVSSIGKIIKGSPADGRYVQIELPEGLNLDLFIPQEHDYWRQFVVRTGSSEYSAKTIAKGWTNKGWCGTEDGLRLIDECEAKKDKTGKITKWICVSDNSTLPPHWQSEKEFFEWLSVPYIEPENRK